MTITTKELLKNSGDYADIEFTKFNVHYDLSQKKLHCKAYAQSSKGDHEYKVEVAFYDVEPEGLTPDQLKSGVVPTHANILNSPIKVDCDCDSYILGGILKGNIHNDCNLYTDKKLTNYKKKTDRPERNPENKAMGCKHIISFIKLILSEYNNSKK